MSDGGFPTGYGDLPKNANTVETGVIYQCSIIKAADVTDGLSNTYLLGEKYINPDNYATGMDDGDDQSAYIGYDLDTCRWTHSGSVSSYRSVEGVDAGIPMQDVPGVEQVYNFGSSHFQFVQLRLLRRIGPRDRLYHQSRDPSPTGQPQGRADGGWESVLRIHRVEPNGDSCFASPDRTNR